MAFQAEQKIKSQIMNTLGTDQMFRLLSDPEVDVLMKTLGLLRNLLSTKGHIDYIMNLHGKQIMQVRLDRRQYILLQDLAVKGLVRFVRLGWVP